MFKVPSYHFLNILTEKHLACSTPARTHTRTNTLHPYDHEGLNVFSSESPMSCATTPATKEWLIIKPNACITLHTQVTDVTLEYELPQNRSARCR